MDDLHEWSISETNVLLAVLSAIMTGACGSGCFHTLLTDVGQIWRTKDYVYSLEKWMHLHLLNIWLERVPC